MHLQAIPAKTAAARQLLAESRHALPAPLRMLLITVDGRKRLNELLNVARSLGLDESAFTTLRSQGLIAWEGMDAASKDAAKVAVKEAEANRAERARRLMMAKLFALDLAGRMLAGRDRALRDQARSVNSESSFQAWMDECASSIAAVSDGERAAVFRERVAAAVS